MLALDEQCIVGRSCNEVDEKVVGNSRNEAFYIILRIAELSQGCCGHLHGDLHLILLAAALYRRHANDGAEFREEPGVTV